MPGYNLANSGSGKISGQLGIPEKFNPEQWVFLFKKAGAKYIVPVAEHHDGFAMYKTALSKWNAAEMGPKRDIIRELADEIKKQGLIFGLSSHRIEHWFFMNKYQPQLFWFDWWIEQPALDPYRKSFASYYYNKGIEWNKGVVLNYKNTAYPEGTAVLDLERGKLSSIQPLAWQTDDAIGNKSWGYASGNTFKDAQYVITNLIDIVSKNGNLLLNVGQELMVRLRMRKPQPCLEPVNGWI